MSKVKCSIEHSSDINDDGIEVPCIIATCQKCGHETQSFGDSEASIKKCLVLMRDECPKGESNFYVDDSPDFSKL